MIKQYSVWFFRKDSLNTSPPAYVKKFDSRYDHKRKAQDRANTIIENGWIDTDLWKVEVLEG